MTSKEIKIKINGEDYVLSVHANETLLNVIRERIGLTGTKEGCGVGECGACTVLLNGKAVNSCLVLAVHTDGSEVFTVESLAGTDGTLSHLQQAFIDEGALQCGFCTPGMLMSAKGLFMENSNPTEEEIVRSLEGNICRCTGYRPIVRAVQKAVKMSQS